jgi:c-di-GMP-binding flagellar brake protein YcgR
MKIPKKILERRRSIRIEESLPFRIGHRDYEIRAETVNVSAHGAMCLLDRSVPLMTQLEIGLCLPGLPDSEPKERKISIKGIVVRRAQDPSTGKFAVAIFFSEIKPADEKALQNYIHRRTGAS